jgi:hypothetical protein
MLSIHLRLGLPSGIHMARFCNLLSVQNLGEIYQPHSQMICDDGRRTSLFQMHFTTRHSNRDLRLVPGASPGLQARRYFE